MGMRTLVFVIWLSVALVPSAALSSGNPASGLRKIKALVVYEDPLFYCAFPSVIQRPDGELVLAFRRAPDRRSMGETGNSHTDSNSQLVLVRSRDGGNTWTSKPELIYSHPFGGSQDPCLLQLKNGTMLCSSYGWALFPTGTPQESARFSRVGNYVFMGGWLLASKNGGVSWGDPIIPATVPGEASITPWGRPIPAYNRGALCEDRNGRLLWVVPSSGEKPADPLAVHLMVSTNSGRTWDYSAVVARDPKVGFNEASLLETRSGALIAFIRTDNFKDHTVIARSTDGGRTFGPWQDAGFQGHPHHAIKLPDRRVVLVYGYRHPPFGVRARLLDPECSDLPLANESKSCPEVVLRDDGGNGDLGYPWVVTAGKNKVLVVYYFNKQNGNRHIAGTICEVCK